MKTANYHFASKCGNTHTLQSLPGKYEVFMFELLNTWKPALRADFSQENKENKILLVCTVHHGWGFRPWFLCIFSLPLFTFWLSARAVFSTLRLKSVFSVLLWLSGSLQRQQKFHNTEEKLGIWLWCPSGCWNKPSAPRRRRILKNIY